MQSVIIAAEESGDRTQLIVAPAVEFQTPSPTSSAWPTVLKAIRSLLMK